MDIDPTEIYNYLDFLWIPFGLLVARKNQRLLTALCLTACLLTLRLEAELVERTGYSTGFLPWLHSPARLRGEIVYGIFFIMYLVLVRFSPQTKGIIFFAASLSVYFMAFIASMVIMAL